MEIRNRLYPYPVLAFYNDDFKNSSFSMEVNCIVEKSLVRFNFDSYLSNDHLMHLIELGDLCYAVHIECPSTSFRKIFFFEKESYEIEIEAGKLNNKVQVCSFIIAKDNIENYTNPDFNDLYKDMTFYIEKNNILAISDYFEITIDKDYDDIKNVNSIFYVLPNNDNCPNMDVSLNEDLIYIKLPIDSYKTYKYIQYSPFHLKIIHSVFILPVLVLIFEKFKAFDIDQFEEYESLRWFKSLRKALEKLGHEFTPEYLSKNDSLALAQIILDNPVIGTLNEIYESGIKENSGDENEG